MELLEREHFLRALQGYVADAATGSGRLVLVSGEAGVGKTALLEAFQDQREDLRWWWSACDGSFTPRPLSPLFEVAYAVGGRLLALCADDADRRELFAASVEVLDAADVTTVLVVEDVQWADDATLDWLRYVSRRIAGTNAVVLITYRDDPPGDVALLRAVLADVATHRGTRRMSLPPLSPDGVRRMIGKSARDAEHVHRLTGGVPFYVREVLSVPPDEVPGTVRDVVAARMAHLSPLGRRLLAAAAVLARPTAPSVLARVAGLEDDAAADALDECLESGSLVGGPESYRFRHELTRLAVERAIPGRQRSRLHASALAALRTTTPADHARLAHHAEEAGDQPVALHEARLAALDAVALRSNREAAAQFRRALRCAGGLDPDDRAALHEGLATALALMDRWEDSAAERTAALALRRGLGDPQRISENLRGLARCLWRMCRGEESESAMREALAVMADCPPSQEKAWTHAFYAALISDTRPPGEALAAAREGLRQAEEAGCEKAVAYSLDTIGTLQAGAGRDAGFGIVAQALELALDQGLDDEAGRAYANLYQAAVDWCRSAEYAWSYEEGSAFCRDRDVATYGVCLLGSRAGALLRTGALAEVAALAEDALRQTVSPVNRLHVLIPLAAARLRRGQPGADDALQQAWQLAGGTAERNWQLRVATVSAEAAWYAGHAGALDTRLVDVARSEPHDHGHPWLRGELAVWLDRLSIPAARPGGVPAPYALELDGEFDAASRWWHEAGCPFEEAVVLTRTRERGRLATALDLLTSIGAEQTAARVRQVMRDAGERGVPRGPRSATRANPDGLTPREAEVLALLHEGLSNAAIARRLYISERTVHHHVSAVLAKLGISSRTEVASRT